MAELVYEGDGLSENGVGDLRAAGFGVVRMGVVMCCIYMIMFCLRFQPQN